MSVPFTTLEEVVARFDALEAAFAAAHDRRAVFLTVYGLMSREMTRRIERRLFRDNEWVARYTVVFADLYREALAACDRGERVPKSWALAFDTAKAGTNLVTQDLLLGMNAHINHDLALALHRVSIDPDRAARYEDHTAVNEVLRALADGAAERVSALYASGLAGVDACAGSLDERITHFSLTMARESAWESSVSLANARNELERRIVLRLLDARAAVVGRLILAPNLSPTVMAACRRVEAGRWWEVLSALRAGARAGDQVG